MFHLSWHLLILDMSHTKNGWMSSFYARRNPMIRSTSIVDRQISIWNNNSSNKMERIQRKKPINKYSSLSLILINFVANTICCFSIHQNHFDVFSHFVSMKWTFGFGEIDVTLHIYSTIYRWYIGMIHPLNRQWWYMVWVVCLLVFVYTFARRKSVKIFF